MSRRAYAAALTLIIAIGCVRIALTYRVFCETADEPAHVAAGMELLTTGRYAVDASHPPLPRLFNAIGPFLDGIRFSDRGDQVASGNVVFYAHDRYLHNLERARLGTLPFFIVAALVVAAWTRALAGDAAALVATALVTNEPSVLAHAGLVTTDMAAAASTITAAYFFWKWLRSDTESLKPALQLAAAVAFALLCKFSAILFVPAACAGALLVERRWPKRALRSLAIAGTLIVVLTWAGYHFTFRTPAAAGAQQTFEQAGGVWAKLVDVHIPAPEFWRGVLDVGIHSKAGHLAYALGKWSPRGWWWYFLLALAVKTTIGFLLLLLAGWRRETRAPLAAGLLILLVSLPVSINIGIRHIIAVYPFFAIAAGAAAVAIWRTRRTVAALLVAAAIVPSLLAHPHYLAYFNAFAGPRPDNVLLDSNLDWGQDLLFLAKEAKRRHIEERLSLAFSGTAQPDRHGLDYTRVVDPMRYTPGWIAISEMLIHKDNRAYRWLDLFQPVARVGKSIRLYYVPTEPELLGGHAIIPESASADGGVYERILLPAWFSGTLQGGGTGLWECDLAIRNDSAHETPIRTRPGAEPVVRIAPESTVVNPPLGLGFAQHGAMLYVPRGDAAALHFTLHLHPPDGNGIVIPVLPARAASSTALQFVDVPMDDNSRATLRIYDLSGEATSAVVRMFDLGGNEAALRVVQLHAGNPRETFPPATEINLINEFPEMRGRRVRVEVEPPSAQFWSFVSVTRFPAKSMYTMLPN